MKLAHCFLKNRELLKRAVYGIVGVLVLTAVAWANGSDLPPPGVTMFSPQGEIKGVRQVVARFSQELVSFGGPRLEDPFTIECPAIGKGRWADGRKWVYDFDDDLKAGVECIFTLRAGLKTLGGNTITGERVFSFNTGGPQVTEADPRRQQRRDRGGSGLSPHLRRRGAGRFGRKACLLLPVRDKGEGGCQGSGRLGRQRQSSKLRSQIRSRQEGGQDSGPVPATFCRQLHGRSYLGKKILVEKWHPVFPGAGIPL